MNQELEQYLWIFVDHRQKDWPEWLVSAEFLNNKIYMATKVLPFIVNYGRELRMGGDIRKKEKVEKAMEFVEGVCGKNEASIRGDRGGSEEDTRRYEETSR